MNYRSIVTCLSNVRMNIVQDKLMKNRTTNIQYLGPAVREQHAVFSRGDFAVVTLPVVEFVTGVVIVHIHIEAEGLTLLF